MSNTPLPVVVVGAGLAGLCTALELAQQRRVIVLAKRRLTEAATPWAQGGIVGVLGADDSVDAHVHDTRQAGAGLVDERAARFVSQQSAAAIEWLLQQDVPFTDDAGGPLGLHLTREGGHSVRRIAHAADATGRAVHDTLLARAAAHPNITLREQVFALDLITSQDVDAEQPPGCHGVYALNIASGRVEALAASVVVLATGGIGHVYRHTTNPGTATGDGIAMAWRAGCRVANMEFIQFHPTCLHNPSSCAPDRSFVITEALRGEGACLLRPDARGGGTRFMPAHDARAELAPRDIVTRAIDLEMRTHGLDHVLLDATHLGEVFLKTRFPTIHARCLQLGIDIARHPIPVVPAAHYTCGGVVTDLDGRTDLPGLYVVGEAAYTGLHGANRLASNSLLECVVLGRTCAAHIAGQPTRAAPVLRRRDSGRLDTTVAQAVIARTREALRQLMWNDVGIVRTTRGLERALQRIALLRSETRADGTDTGMNRDFLELRNLLDCAELVVRSALTRHESRGLHFNRDHPGLLPASFPTVLAPSGRGERQPEEPSMRIE